MYPAIKWEVITDFVICVHFFKLPLSSTRGDVLLQHNIPVGWTSVILFIGICVTIVRQWTNYVMTLPLSLPLSLWMICDERDFIIHSNQCTRVTGVLCVFNPVLGISFTWWNFPFKLLLKWILNVSGLVVMDVAWSKENWLVILSPSESMIITICHFKLSIMMNYKPLI